MNDQIYDAEKIIDQHVIADSAKTGVPNPPLSVTIQPQHQDTTKPGPATEGDHPQPDPFKEPSVPPAKKTKKAPARKAALLQEFHSQIQEDMQWIFMLDREKWHVHLPSGWAT